MKYKNMYKIIVYPSKKKQFHFYIKNNIYFIVIDIPG